MKNRVYYLLKGKVTLNITGKNIERFIKRLKTNNIEILNIKYKTYDSVIIKIYKYDYKKILTLKTTYDIKIIEYYGLIKYKNNILNNNHIIFSILVGFILLYILSNTIFSIDVITNNKEMKKKLEYELKLNGIEKYKFKKSYEELQIIKKKILSKYKEQIEWIEIEVIGTKYVIKYEPRIINNIETIEENRNIIAKKDAVIKGMNVSRGQIVKSVNTYVKKGEVIVSGNIYMNDVLKDTVSSTGTIYGEVWYNVTINYPYNYYEKKETGRSKDVFVIRFLNKEIELFNFNKYKTKNINNKTILKNNLLPISINYQNQKETLVISQHNAKDNIDKKAIEYSNKTLESNLKEGEYINHYKILNKTYYDNSVTFNIFYSVVENITEYSTIHNIEETLE